MPKNASIAGLCNNRVMPQNQGLDYYDLQDVLDMASPGADPADAHGLMCGLICAAGSAEPRRWLGEVLEDYDPADRKQARAFEALKALYQCSLAGLHSEELDFELMIPEDDATLAERTESLGRWCSGFLSGLGLGGLPPRDKLPEDAAEMIDDIARFARVDFDAGDDDETERVAFEEILEYLRIGVLYLHDELQPAPASAPEQIQ